MTLIRSEEVEPLDDLDHVAKEIGQEIEKRLDERLPDDIGVVWPAISKIVVEAAITGVQRGMQRAADLVVEGAIHVAEEAASADPIRWNEIPLSSSELADEVSKYGTLDRQIFFAEFVSRLSPDALADLTSEVLRQ